ncbi:MAG: hypothetical protein GY764_10615 [Halieaceae bacterium]|nr:hypothetical protein [Halieaceae bacterium]
MRIRNYVFIIGMVLLSVGVTAWAQQTAQKKKKMAGGSKTMAGINVETGKRERLDMNGIWRCHPDWKQQGEKLGYWKPGFDFMGGNWGGPGSKMWREVKIPCTYTGCGPDMRRAHGMAWFRKSFTIPKSWEGKRIVIRFEGVNFKSRIWVNGKHVLDHPDGLLRFEVPLDDVINYGVENVIIVSTDNTRRKGDRSPGSENGYLCSGGIVGNVEIIACDPAHIDSARFITAEPVQTGGKFSLAVTVENGRKAEISGKLVVDMMDLSGKVHGQNTTMKMGSIQAGSNNKFIIEGSVAGVKAWSPDSPNLYMARVSLQLAGKIVDSETYRFGFRKIEIRGTKLYLNNKPLLLNGINHHDDTPDIEMAWDEASLRKDLELIKEMGANFVRLPHAPRVAQKMDLYDEMGLMVAGENNLHWFYGDGGPDSKEFASASAAAKRQLKKMILRDMSHPSIIMWIVSNESGRRDKRQSYVIELLKDCMRLAKGLDPSRPVTHVSDKWSPEQIKNNVDDFAIDDVICINQYMTSPQAWKDRLEYLHKAYPNKPIVITEFGCGGNNYEAKANYFKSIVPALSAPYVAGIAVYDFVVVPYLEHRQQRLNWGIFPRDRTPTIAVDVLKDLFADRNDPVKLKAMQDGGYNAMKGWLKPPRVWAPAKSRDPTTVASSEFSADYHAGYAHDGILSSQEGENFWASADRQDVGAWWQKDLGKKSPIERIQIQFRGFGGVYHFVPKTITFQVSDDGKKWTTVVSKSADVPANNSPYAATLHTYELNAEGRYVRLLFEDGTEEVIGGTKVVELVEVKVNGKVDAPVAPAVIETAAPVKEVRVVLPAEDSKQMKRIVSVFARQVEERCSAKVTTQGDAPLTVTLAVDPKIGKEGFRISDRDDGGIEVVGQNERGVIYGLGKLLRTSRYSKDGFAAGKWRGESVPKKPIRGIYFATHFHNYYHDAPVEEIERYVEELALWGFNELLVWYDMHHFNGADDPAAVTFQARLRAILLAAKRVGMDVSLVLPANEAYGNSPAELRRTPGAGRGGDYPCAVCPSKPAGLEYILKVVGEEFDWAADLRPRSIWIWPYDQGGCGCAECRPWGAKGYMKCVREVGKLAREKMPGVEILMSMWYIDENEWRGIREQLTGDKGLVDGIVSEPGPHGIRIAPNDLGLPLIGFPEISMHGTFPWGGFGATPLTARARSQWNGVKATHAGGFPYSEGIYEDLTKVVFSQLYWNDRPVEETVKEYIAYEFSPDVVEEVAGVVKTLERNHHMRWWPGKLEGVKLEMNWFPSRGAKPQADPGAEEAYATMKRVDKKLSPQTRTSWRWRILYLRALLDAELKTNAGKPNELCNQAFAELIEIYHAQDAIPGVRPPLSR